LRIKILETIFNAQKGHIGGAYSCIDILTALYYGDLLNLNKSNFSDKNRNRFLMSKGHAAIAQYVILHDLGLLSDDDLDKMNNGGLLGEHPDVNIPGIEFNSGSLGHGLGIAAGWALAAKMDNLDYTSYVLLGDGECYEGTIWEAANLCSHLKLSNLVAIVDRNRLCIHGNTEDINALEPFDKKWESFGWDVKIIDGHNFVDILNALKEKDPNKPLVLIAETTKGKGVDFMENNPKWHHGGIDLETFNSSKKQLLENS
jgi:transketolase